MDKQYWQNLAGDFSERVIEVPDSDVTRVLEGTARRLGGKKKFAIDFGCGPGASTRILAPYFGEVLGVDFAPGLLERARRQTTAKNVSYGIQDLQASPPRRTRKADVGFCVNVLLHPDVQVRDRIIRSVKSGVKKGGSVVFVVPALESSLRTYQVLLEIGLRNGDNRREAVRELNHQAKKELLSVVEGIVLTGGEPTKHYLRDELAGYMERHRINVTDIQRVSFPWDEEIVNVPSWLKGPLPWDWMVEGISN